MKKWRWRIALLVVGFVIISCSLCLVAYSHLQTRREMEQEVVPIEVPPAESSSRWMGLGVM
ncbi:MAG: hypothetical protein JXA14_00540 [Anaerolineae bacterium]|nr:hypothetical protein [Anaerolineae bacterium]